MVDNRQNLAYVNNNTHATFPAGGYRCNNHTPHPVAKVVYSVTPNPTPPAQTVLLVQDPHPVLLEGRAADGEGDVITDFSGSQWRQFVGLRMQQWNFQTQLAVDLADDLLVLYLEELQVSQRSQEQGGT